MTGHFTSYKTRPNHELTTVFHTSVADLGHIAQSAGPEPKQLAEQAFRSLLQNGYGQFDGLIQVLQPALGPAGLEHLKQRMIALSIG